jgi:hypothetical protein
MRSPPMLGFDAVANLVRVEWKDGTTVCGGILGHAFDPAALARQAAEQARKEELRQQPNVVLLEDYLESRDV